MHTPSMGERSRRRRVLVEDARHRGQHLRATWHPEARQFVVSTWSDDVCTGAARLDPDAAGALAALIVDGLADGATHEPTPAPVPDTRPGLAGLVDRLRWLVQGTATGGSRPASPGGADVRPLRRRSA